MTPNPPPPENRSRSGQARRSLQELDLEAADGCRLNPLLIEGHLGGRAALEIAVPGLPLGADLAAYFDTVETVPAAPNILGPSSSLAFSDGSFDLVTLYGLRPSPQALAEIRRVLGRGGTLFLGVPNQWWYGRFRTRKGWSTGNAGAGPWLAKRVRAAGFGEVRSYFVEPSLVKPREVIPAQKTAVQVIQQIRRSDGGGGVMRSDAVVRLHLFHFLFPARVLLATA
jgi:SAM-dependent methyltransferase